MQSTDKPEDAPSYCLFTAWCKAEFQANFVLNQVQEDMLDPRYLDAEKQAQKALWDFLCKPTSSLYGILLKLKVACHFDDYVMEALDPASRLVSPRAIVAAKHDLENIVIACFGAESVKKQDEDLEAVARYGLDEAGAVE